MDASTMMIIGKVATGNENLESWGVLQFPPLGSQDSINRIVGIRLLLKNIPYKYGDTTSSHIDFQVFEAPPGNKITYSTIQIAASDYTVTPIGTIKQDGFTDSTDRVLAIPIDTAIKKDLLATSFIFLVAPTSGMVNARGFGTSENTGDANSIPQLEYTIDTGQVGNIGPMVVYRTPVLDMHVIKDQTVTPPHEFTLRGGTGLRELVFDSLMRPTDSAQLNAFSTINNAVLVLKLDASNSAHSNLAVDTSGPLVLKLTNVVDTGAVLWTQGYHDASDPTILRFQLRTLIEFWLRNPTQNFGLELRAGYVPRVFAGAVIGVEDNTINRWTFYGQDYPDSTKRPQLVLSYSKLPR